MEIRCHTVKFCWARAVLIMPQLLLFLEIATFQSQAVHMTCTWPCVAVLCVLGAFGSCPPADFACVAAVDSKSWQLRAQVDKALSQRTYELLTIHDWIPKEESRSQIQFGSEENAKTKSLGQIVSMLICFGLSQMSCPYELPFTGWSITCKRHSGAWDHGGGKTNSLCSDL